MKKSRPIHYILSILLLTALLLISPAALAVDDTSAPQQNTAADPAAAKAESDTGADVSAPGEAVAQAAALTQKIIATRAEELVDNYFGYYTAEEYAMLYADYQGSFGGIGVSMISDGEYVTVYNVIEGSPASKTPIAVGERIIAVDGESIIGMDSSAAAGKIRGTIGTAVTLTVQKPDDSCYDVTIVRDEIVNESIRGEIIEEAPNTGYILIYDFTEKTPEEFINIFNKLREQSVIDRLIIDLRSNGGGSMYAALNIAQLFVPAGEVILSEKSAEGTNDYTSTSGLLHDTQLYVLQNTWTASASEILIGALADKASAVSIGTVSFGKGITQTITLLENGSALRYTRSRYFTPHGYDLHGIGLLPEYEVKDPENITSEEYFSTDPKINPHLQKAVELIKADSAAKSAAQKELEAQEQAAEGTK